MFWQNQPRPKTGFQPLGGGEQQEWRGGEIQRREVKVLSSSGYGVYGGVQQQRQAGVGVTQQRPVVGSYQPRGHYKGSVVIAGDGPIQTGRKVGSAVGMGTGGRNQFFSAGPQLQQPLAIQGQGQRQGSIYHNQNSSSSGQVSSRNSCTPGPPSVSATSSNSSSKSAPPVNTFLSAFEKSFESFLNSKYNDEEETATNPNSKVDPNSVENISNILNDYSKSSSSALPSNPLSLSKPNSVSLSAPVHARDKAATHQANLRSNPHTKPKFNPVQEAKVPRIPESLTLTTMSQSKSLRIDQPNVSSPHQSKTLSHLKSKSVSANNKSPYRTNTVQASYQSPWARNSTDTSLRLNKVPPADQPKVSSPHQSKTLSHLKSKSMPANNKSPYRTNTVQASYQSPQATISTDTSLRLNKAPPSVETIELEPETVVLDLDGPEVKPVSTDHNQPQVIADVDRVYQCNLCPKTFKSSSYLRDHEITHTGNYPFKCETCKKGFLREKQLNNHKCSIKEEKTKPFKCSDCTKAYASKQSLRDHKCSSAAEDKQPSKIENLKEEEIIGEIVESIELDVPVVEKFSDIAFSSISGVALISGDLIEYDDFECDLEEAEMHGWELEVIGHDNMILDENTFPMEESTEIPDGIIEIAKGSGLSADEVRQTLEFFLNPLPELETFVKFPWQEIESEYEKNEQLKIDEKLKEKLLLEEEKVTPGSTTLDEIDGPESKDVLGGKTDDISKLSSVSKFAYFNDKLETTVHGESGDESDEDWTFGEEFKCKTCKKKCSSKWHLKKHVQTHTTDKDKKGTYKCNSCNKSFKRKDLRDKHSCDAVMSTSVLIVSDMSSAHETLLEETAVPVLKKPRGQSLLLHSTLV